VDEVVLQVSEAPSPAPAPPLVFAEECTSTEALLRKMIVDKISGFEKSVTDLETSIADKERLIAIDKVSLAKSLEDARNLKEQLSVLDNIAPPVTTNQTKNIDTAVTQTNTWTIIDEACSFWGENMISSDARFAAYQQQAKTARGADRIHCAKRFSEASGGSVGGFDLGGCVHPRAHTADEMIRAIRSCWAPEAPRQHMRLYIAPGASLVLLKELEKNYKVLYDISGACEATSTAYSSHGPTSPDRVRFARNRPARR
jgi:hypothetical protein